MKTHKLGYIGLGKMGFNMVERLIEKHYAVTVYDKNRKSVNKIAIYGAQPAKSIKNLILSLDTPRLIWIMVPHQAIDSVLRELIPYLQQGDTIVDGGNSSFRESMRRSQELQRHGIDFLDVGVSGGPSGARNGACIMVGGRKNVFHRFRRLFRDLACRGGFGYMGRSGAGHFVKMVHNGIEYGMMQAIAEGFSIMRKSPFSLNLKEIADLYNHRSVIESRLVGWLQQAFELYGDSLLGITGTVAHSGEGAWTVEAARALGVPVPVIEEALNFRIRSRYHPDYAGQILSAMRNQFGGHDVRKNLS
jgi:6-phosphogluconate dehydrogenase